MTTKPDWQDSGRLSPLEITQSARLISFSTRDVNPLLFGKSLGRREVVGGFALMQMLEHVSQLSPGMPTVVTALWMKTCGTMSGHAHTAIKVASALWPPERVGESDDLQTKLTRTRDVSKEEPEAGVLSQILLASATSNEEFLRVIGRASMQCMQILQPWLQQGVEAQDDERAFCSLWRPQQRLTSSQTSSPYRSDRRSTD